MGKLRYGKWKEQDSGIKYGEISVTDSVYRKNEGKEFGAQTIDYIDANNQLKMAVIAYDRNEGKGINFKDINDIRQTFFHEWTHVMELDKIKTNQETEVSLNGRIFKNNEKKENGEIWGEGLVTREYGTNAKLYATNVDAIGNKRIMHNQIDEGAVELIARKVMGNVLGEERAKKVIDSKRYYPNVKVIQELMKAGGEERFITLFTTNSQKLISMLEKINIEDRDALHYMSDFVNDETTQGMIPKYSPKTNLYKEIQEKGLQKTVLSAMNYSVKAGGKRLRPMLMAETYEMFGGADSSVIEPFMAAIEMIHTYSLIHDDLPALDNDALRRGMPTAHIKFGEAMAILAGDALLNYAFETAAKAFDGTNKDIQTAKALQILTRKPGIYGMIGGQTVDVEQENKAISFDTLMYIHNNKTAALIECAMMIGAVLAGASEKEVSMIEQIANKVGIAFQIEDDILDVVSTSEEIGKPAGSDEKNGKNTYVLFKGIEQSKKDAEQYTREALQIFDELEYKNPFLRELLLYLVGRKN